MLHEHLLPQLNDQCFHSRIYFSSPFLAPALLTGTAYRIRKLSGKYIIEILWGKKPVHTDLRIL